MRAPNSGIRLSISDAAIVKGMIARGDRQHDIAAWFGVNGGRIGEISRGRTFVDVAAVHDHLPPPGPYLSGQDLFSKKGELSKLLKRMRKRINELSDDRLSSIFNEVEKLASDL